MRPVKLTMFLVVAVVLGWTASTALAGEANPASGQGGGAAGRTTMPQSNAALERVEGLIIGIARTSTSTTLTIRVTEPNTLKRDIRVEFTSQTPISQGILAKHSSDLTVGSHVWLDCEQQNGRLKADEMGILDPSVPVMELEGPDITPS